MDEQTEINPHRRLCPDGTCTGIIDTAGRCGECGRLASGGSTTDFSPTAPATEVLDPDDPASSGSAAIPSASGEVGGGAVPSPLDPDRRLCDDGTCVGVIGPGGVCTICGKPAV